MQRLCRSEMKSQYASPYILFKAVRPRNKPAWTLMIYNTTLCTFKEVPAYQHAYDWFTVCRTDSSNGHREQWYWVFLVLWKKHLLQHQMEATAHHLFLSIKLNYSTCSSKEKLLKALFTIHFIQVITDSLHKHFRSGNSSTGTKM